MFLLVNNTADLPSVFEFYRACFLRGDAVLPKSSCEEVECQPEIGRRPEELGLEASLSLSIAHGSS